MSFRLTTRTNIIDMNKITLKDYIKANRRSSRNEEIEFYGRQVIRRSVVHKSKKVYDRNKLKREMQTL